MNSSEVMSSSFSLEEIEDEIRNHNLDVVRADGCNSEAKLDVTMFLERFGDRDQYEGEDVILFLGY